MRVIRYSGMADATAFEILRKHFDSPALDNDLGQEGFPRRLLPVDDGDVVLQTAIRLPRVSLVYLGKI